MVNKGSVQTAPNPDSKSGKDYEVTCSMEGLEPSSYTSRGSYYDAKVEGLRLFLEEYGIPGSPTQYLTGDKKGLIQIEVKCREDRRRIKPAVVPQMSFIIERVDTLRNLIRTGEIPRDMKGRCLDHLLHVRRELDGLRLDTVANSAREPKAGVGEGTSETEGGGSKGSPNWKNS